MKKNCFILILLLLFGCQLYAQPTRLSSPDGKLRLFFFLNQSGRMYYQVSVNKKEFISNSSLGLEAKNGVNLLDGYQIVKTKFTHLDKEWTQPWGENKKNRNHYNEMAVGLKNQQGTDLTLRFRLFNDGIGFRYEYKVPTVDSIFVTNEVTSFNIKNEGISWSIPANNETYELLYKTQKLSELHTANTPMTFKTDDGIYASIHEAALINFPEMTLLNIGGKELQASLAPWPDGVKAKMKSEFVTPWRTIQVASKAVGLINSSLILNLNEPCALSSTDWIKPVKYVGVWWGMHLGVQSWAMDERHGATTQNAKKYIDFAHDNNIQAVLFEGWNKGWESWGGQQHFDYTQPYADFDIKEIARYAKEKSIQIIGHHETGGNIPNYENQLDKSLEWYTKMGIGMLKTGYAGGIPGGYSHQGQYGVVHYERVVQSAAKYRMTIDAHEVIKDTGIRRTYPNMMSRECGRGMEWNAWSDGNPPEHYEMLPFTRLLSGPMDYTPGVFDILYKNTRDLKTRKKWNDLDKGTSRVNTTLAKQIANWVVLYSPMQMAADMIENYQGHPAFQFFRDYDADCDKSIALAGEPGEFVVVVRQAKNRFYLGATTNEIARNVNVKLDFLDAGKKYQAIIYADGKNADWKTNPTDYKITKCIVTSRDTLHVVMAKGGGQAVSFMPL